MSITQTLLVEMRVSPCKNCRDKRHDIAMVNNADGTKAVGCCTCNQQTALYPTAKEAVERWNQMNTVEDINAR